MDGGFFEHVKLWPSRGPLTVFFLKGAEQSSPIKEALLAICRATLLKKGRGKKAAAMRLTTHFLAHQDFYVFRPVRHAFLPFKYRGRSLRLENGGGDNVWHLGKTYGRDDYAFLN